MEREEIEAMWERIKALEENGLKICKTMGELIIVSLLGHMIDVSKAAGKFKNFKAYMEPKANQAVQHLKDAQSVDKALQVVREFTEDCFKFTESLVK